MNLIDTLDQIDRSIFLEINSWHIDWLDSYMWYISHPVCWVPVYVLFLFAAYKKYGNRGILWILIGVGIVVLFADTIHRECFKEVFQRLRPSRNPELDGLVHLVTNPKSGKEYTGGRFGFISGHASNFTGIAVFVALFLSPKRVWFISILFWALLISYSRIYLGVHYPGDILGGIILGILTGVFSHYIVQKFIIKKFT